MCCGSERRDMLNEKERIREQEIRRISEREREGERRQSKRRRHSPSNRWNLVFIVWSRMYHVPRPNRSMLVSIPNCNQRQKNKKEWNKDLMEHEHIRWVAMRTHCVCVCLELKEMACVRFILFRKKRSLFFRKHPLTHQIICLLLRFKLQLQDLLISINLDIFEI